MIFRPEILAIKNFPLEVLTPLFINPWWMPSGVSASNVVAVYQPKGAADQVSSYVNLANPGTFDAAPGVAPTWSSSTGWSFDGTQFLGTGIVNIASTYSVYFRYSALTASAPNTYFVGTQSLTPPPRYAVRYTGGVIQFLQGSNQNGSSISLTAGTVGMAGTQGYYNGATNGSTMSSAAAISQGFWIGGLNNGGTVFQPIIASIQAVAIYNAVLDSTQISALHTAMNVL